LGGGGGVLNALLAAEMAKRHEVTVLTSQGLGLPRESIDNGLRIVRAPVFFRRQEAVANLPSMLAFMAMGIVEGRKLLRNNSFDIINTQFVVPTGPVGDALSRFAGIPNVLTLHGGDLYDPSKLMSPHRHRLLRAWVSRLLRRASLVVGDSRDNLDNMRRYYTPEIQGIRIPLGIQRSQVGRLQRKRYGFGDDEVLLVTVGRLIPRKAIMHLISMMETLRDRRVGLLIVGTGPEEKLLKSESRKRQLEHLIRFTGHVAEDEKFGILQMCDLYVSTSQHEGFGLVFLEAMACGLPIVCYDKGGQTDFLRDKGNGYLVPLNDLALLTKRCELLITDTELRKTMGENNKSCVEEYYIDRCALRYETTFNEVLQMNANAKQANRHLSPQQASYRKG
jgi:glycosyltransferase involved in cell wall biosynthesis